MCSICTDCHHGSVYMVLAGRLAGWADGRPSGWESSMQSHMKRDTFDLRPSRMPCEAHQIELDDSQGEVVNPKHVIATAPTPLIIVIALPLFTLCL